MQMPNFAPRIWERVYAIFNVFYRCSFLVGLYNFFKKAEAKQYCKFNFGKKTLYLFKISPFCK